MNYPINDSLILEALFKFNVQDNAMTDILKQFSLPLIFLIPSFVHHYH